MKVFESLVGDTGLYLYELEDCVECLRINQSTPDIAAFNLCPYHEGFVVGYERGWRDNR